MSSGVDVARRVRRLRLIGGVGAVGVVVVVTAVLALPTLRESTIEGELDAVRFADAAFPTSLVITDDGVVFFAENLTGRIGVLIPGDDGSLEERTFATVELPEGGRLLHLLLHPDWPAQPYLYATAHQSGPDGVRMSVLRFRSTDFVSDELEIVVAGLPAEDLSRGPEADHHGSALATCGEYLFVSVGDTDSPGPGGPRPGNIRARAQSFDYAEGKVLRYRFAGADLEPAGIGDSRFPIFAIGFRNVFAMDCDAATGLPVVADNGDGGHDQIRFVEPGSNHEWPLTEERADQNPPLFDSGETRLAPTGIIARQSGNQTELLMSVFHLEAIYRLMVDANGVGGELELVHRANGSILAIAQDARGCTYFATSDGLWLLSEPRCDRELAAAAVDAGNSRFDAEPSQIFQANCAACHGTSRGDGGAPSLLSDALTESDDFYIATILGGRAGGMPSWAVAGMSEEQARAMLAYLRSQTD